MASVHDGVYIGAGASLFKAPPSGFLHDGIGTEFDASAKYIFHKSFVVMVKRFYRTQTREQAASWRSHVRLKRTARKKVLRRSISLLDSRAGNRTMAAAILGRRCS